MDPDEALEMMRKGFVKLDLAVAAAKDDDYDDSKEALQAVDQIVDHARALDEWISKGGFLPKAWRGNPAVALIQWDNGPTVFGPFIDLESAARFITNVVAPTHKMYVLPLNMLHPSEYQEWDNEGGSDDDDGS